MSKNKAAVFCIISYLLSLVLFGCSNTPAIPKQSYFCPEDSLVQNISNSWPILAGVISKDFDKPDTSFSLHGLNSAHVYNSEVNVYRDTIFSFYRGKDNFSLFRGNVAFHACLFLPCPSEHLVLKNYTQEPVLAFPFNRFQGSVWFEDCNFTKPLLFRDCVFDKIVKLSPDTACHSDIIFGTCRLNAGLSLSGSNLMSNLKFEDCDIHGKLLLSGATFKNNVTVSFKNSFLPDTIDLSNTTLSEKVDLLAGKLRKDEVCQINLLNTDIDQIRFLYGQVKLYFPDSVHYNQQYKDQVHRVYQRLLSKFKEQGLEESYHKVDIEYYDWSCHFRPLLYFSNLWWQYGYNKARILLWLSGFLFLFFVLNWSLYKRMQMTYPIPSLGFKNIQYTGNVISRISKRVFFVLLYTGLIFFRWTIDFKNVNTQKTWFVILLIFEYSVGIVCNGFLLNWILKG